MSQGTLIGQFFRIYVGVLLLLATGCESEDVPDADVRINHLSEQVTAVLEHFKSPDPVGMPMFPIPDPMPIPNIKHSIGFGNYLVLSNQTIHGLSKFRIESIYSNLADMEMTIALRIEVLQVLGNSTIRTWLSSYEGASNITLTEIRGEGSVKLEVAREGHLEAIDLVLNPSVMDIDVDLENPGLMGSVLQGAMNSVGTFVFDAIKPYLMAELKTRFLGDVNKVLRSFKRTFSNSLSPLDIVFLEGRKMVRSMGYDPYKVKDVVHTTGVLSLEASHIWMSGFSSFHRVGNITVSMENNTVYTTVPVGIQGLEGQCLWYVSMAGLVSTSGMIKFTIEYFEVEAKINQTLDVRNRPNLEDLRITLGNFQLQFDGAGTMDYVIEAVVNILPNLLRYHIMLAIEEPLRIKVQEIFNEIDVEKTIKDLVQQLEKGKELSLQLPNHDDKIPISHVKEEGLSVDESRLDESIF